MIHWRDLDIDETAEDLLLLADLCRETDPEVIVSAAPREVATFLGSRATCEILAAEAARDTRPQGVVLDRLAERRALVYLVGASGASAFSWAAAMRMTRSVLICKTPGEIWPDMGRVGFACLMRGTIFVARRLTDSGTEPSAPDDVSPLTRRTRPRRPLRSVFLGDLRYPSLYRAGVAQGMALHGAWHREVSILADPGEIDQQVREMCPDVVWTHMLLWPPANGPAGIADLLGMAERWRRGGTFVLVHDGDPRPRTRFPQDVSSAVDLALLNHDRAVSEWRVPTLRWRYGALVQAEIAEPLEAFRTDLVFAGLLRDGELYGPRTACVQELARRLGLRVYPDASGLNNRFQTPEMAASATAIIGFGRPEAPGWIDTRVFTVPGAGGVLIHDDAGGILEPGRHYVPCVRYDVDSIATALEIAKREGGRIRCEGFAFVQAHHTYRERCQEVLAILYGP